MADTSNAISSVETAIREQLKEIETQRKKLEAALKQLTSGGTTRTRASTPSAAGVPPVSRSGRQRRSRKGGTRAEHALAAIREQPGIGASGIAEKLKIKPNYVYRVLSDLRQDGLVVKEGRGYQVAPGS